MYILPKLRPDEILVYLRKSRTDDPTLSVEEVLAKHEQMLDEWIERNLRDTDGDPIGERVPECNRFREVVSGETIDSRPAMKQLLRYIESPRYKAVLVVEPQRLSRGDLEDIGRLVKIFRYSNTIVITLTYTYDVADPHDRDSLERELKRGNEFLEYQKRIMNNGRLLAVENGNFIGQSPPYGYNKVRIKEGRRYCYTLEPNPEEAPIVQQIYDLYLQGLGCTRIADHLDAIGAPTRTCNHWSAASIHDILDNEHYIGMVRWNRRKGVRTVEGGEVVERRPRAEKYMICPGKHEAIISQELWNAVQAKRGTIPRNPKAKNFSNPFAGLVYCRCGHAVTRHSYIKNGKERSIPRLVCNNQRYCQSASCSMDEMIEEIVKKLKETIADFEVRFDRGEQNAPTSSHKLIEQLEKRLSELDELEISQWDKYTREGMPKQVFEKLNAKVLSDKRIASQALEEARISLTEPVSLENKLSSFKAALDALQDDSVSIKEKNDLLKACVKRITYYRTPKSVKSRWTPPAPVELELELKL